MKNKKIILWIALMIAVIVTANAQQYDPESDFKAELMEGGKSVRIVGYRGEKWVVRIPPQIQGKPVTHIWERAFAGSETNLACTQITDITIPDSVISIGDYAFIACFSLESINIPDSVTSIGEGAFERCARLTSITIPNSVTSIGKSAFGYCDKLINVTIGNSVTNIGVCAFIDCESLTSITIPKSVTSIGQGAFVFCPITAINVAADNEAYTVVNGVLYNVDKTFLHTYPAGKKGNFTIPNGVITIGEHSFQGCKNLTGVTISNSVTSIESYAFVGTSITSINIPNSVTSIDEYAFYGCNKLTRVTISNSVTSIGENAFRECASLTNITIPNSVNNIGGGAFDSCDKLTNVTFQGTINWASFGNNAFNGNLREVFYATNGNGTPGNYRTSNPGINAKWQKM